MVTNVGLFIAVAVVAVFLCVLFVVGAIIARVVCMVLDGLSRLLHGGRCRGDDASTADACGWAPSPRSRRICTRPGCGKVNLREARYCAQCGQRLDG